MRPDFRSRCSQGENVVKRINLPWTDNRDVHYPTNEPNPTHVENSSRGKAHPNFFKLAHMFGAQIVPLRTPHGMSECLGPTIVESPWAGFDETKRSY